METALAKVQDDKKESKGDGERSASDIQEELDELTQQNLKLRALLSTKREQIATLRTVLKSNKASSSLNLRHNLIQCPAGDRRERHGVA